MSYDDSAAILYDAYEKNRSKITEKIGMEKFDENFTELIRLRQKE